MTMRRVAPLLVLLAALPAAAHTVPSMQNGSFDNTLLPWAVKLDALESFDWSLAADANGSATSRSAEIGIDPATAATTTSLYQCITIDPSRVYEGGVRVFIPADRAAGEVTASLAVRWYSNAECSGAPLTRFLPVDSTEQQGAWTDLRLRLLSAAPGATHAMFALEVSRRGTHVRPARARFDDAYFVTSIHRSIIPAIGSLRGDAGSVWWSDLHLVNHGEAALRATLLYRCLAGTTCNMRPRELTLAARESVLLRDAAASFFESPGSTGTLEVFSDAPTLAVSARLNSAAPRGTFGAEVPALRESDLSSTRIFLGIRNGPGFRTNVGVYNAQENVNHLTISLHVDGRQVASLSMALAPRTLVHMNVFQALGVPQTVTDHAYVMVSAVNGAVAPFVSVIDNATNDVAFSNGLEP